MRQAGALVVALLALVAATAAPAHTQTTPPILDPANRAAIKALIQTEEPTTFPAEWDSTRKRLARTGWYRLQSAAGGAPTLRQLGALTLAPAAFTVGWKIGDGLGGFVYKKITGDDLAGTPASGWAGTWKWDPLCASGCTLNGSGFTAYGLSSSSDGWMLRFTATEVGSSTWTHGCGIPYGTGNCTVATVGGNVGNLTDAQNAAASTGSLLTANTGTACNRSAGEACQILVRSDRQMERRVQVEKIDASEWSALTDKRTAGDLDTGTVTDTELDDGLDAINAGDEGAQDDADEAAIEWITFNIDPDAVLDEVDEIVTLPKPGPLETYQDYLVRLRAGGWLGEADVTVLTPETIDEAVGPSGVSKVRLLLESGTVVHSTATWPAQSPRFHRDTAIRLVVNPAEGVDVPGGESELDFTPLTELDPGCKFPYGFICYATEVTGWFDVSADAPVFSFDVNDVETPVGTFDLGTYGPVDLNVMDAWASLWRALVTVVLWIGGVYWLAVSLLGFRAGGDPGEALDDVL